MATVEGTSGDDDLSGNEASEVLYGYKGDDYIDGWGGHDTLHGHKGDDILVGNPDSNDVLYGGAGADTFSLYINSDDATVSKDRHTVRCDDGTVYKLPDFSEAEGDTIEYVYDSGYNSCCPHVGVNICFMINFELFFYDRTTSATFHNIINDRKALGANASNSVFDHNRTVLGSDTLSGISGSDSTILGY